MEYFFSGNWHEVPVYGPHERCRRVAIHYAIPVARTPTRDQRVIDPSWRKIIAFLLAEGPRTTIRKVRSKQIAWKLASDYHVVFAVGRDLDAVVSHGREPRPSYLCLGTRHPPCADVMLFAMDLTVPIEGVPSMEVVARAVSRTLTQKVDVLDKIGGYNVHSHLPVPADALHLLDTVAASINDANYDRTVTDIDSLKPMRPPQRAAPSRKRADYQRISRLRRSTHGATVIAGGDYVRTDVIPALNRAGFGLCVVTDIEPHIAGYTKRRFGFDRAETDWRRALDHSEADTVIVASYHDSHAMIASEALARGKSVLLEKPPVVTRQDLAHLLGSARAGGFLDIGYNRRYAPFSRTAKQLLSETEGPATITMLIREVEIPPQHWYRWPRQGTRVTGNVCHWIDLAIFLVGSQVLPREITVSAPADIEPDEERTFSIVFDDDTAVTIIATQRGDPTLGVQELIEIRRGNLSIRIDDFRRLDATSSGRKRFRSRSRRNKGHRAMYDEMLRRIKSGQPPLYTIRDLEVTSLLTIIATEMIRTGNRTMTLSRQDLVCSSTRMALR